MASPQTEFRFDGASFDQARDGKRLSRQLEKVKELLLSGKHSLREMAEKVGGSEAGVSARCRDLRKERFGGFDVRRENKGGGLWVYWIQKGNL